MVGQTVSGTADASPAWRWSEPTHTHQLSLTVTPNAGGDRQFAEAKVDYSLAVQQAGSGSAEFDPTSIVVHEVDAAGAVLDGAVAFQFDPDDSCDATSAATGELVIDVVAPTDSVARSYAVYFASVADTAPGAIVSDEVVLDDSGIDEGFAAWSLTTASREWWCQPEAGRFSSLVDGSGQDWIGWSTAGGAAAEFRGIPNMVHPESWFYPGATGHATALAHDGPLRVSWSTVSPDDQWEVRWHLYPTCGEMIVERVGTKDYWVLYESTPGGSLDLTADTWERSDGANGTANDTFDGDIADPEWIRFADSP